MIWLKARVWAALAAIGALLAVVGAIYGKGRSDARANRDAQDGKDYIAERRRQDALDIGHGASDSERIRRLRAIADRNGSSKN